MSGAFLARIADAALNRPLMITPDKAAVIMSVLAGRIRIDAAGLAPEASRFVGDGVERDANGKPIAGLPYRRTPDGVGVITVAGSLVNRGAWIGANSGLVSYEGIKHQLGVAAADPKVRSIILDMSSPGGEAIGALETADAVRAVAAIKPVVAVVNGMAASAGYAIASGATEIVTTPTGVAGSIGVIMVHADYSEALADEGIKPTIIFAGAHKADGNSMQPLPDSVRADLQAEIDAFYQQFLSTVALGRGERLSAEMARKTEARVFIGAAAVEAGLADRVGSFESVLAELSRAPKGRSSTSLPKGLTMSETTGAPAAENAGITKADLDRAVAAAHADGVKLGASQERARIGAILAHSEAEGRDAQARTLAIETDLSAEQAGKVLASSPRIEAKPIDLAAIVAETGVNAVGAQPGQKTAENESVAARALADHRRLTGGAK